MQRVTLIFAVFCTLFASSVSSQTQTPQSRAEISLSFAPVVRQAAPAVVNIYAKWVTEARQTPFMNDPFFAGPITKIGNTTLLTSIDILLDHPDFVVVNKPSNIAVQNEAHQTGIIPILCQQLNIEQLWLVHRLDKVTSGILVLAKHQKAAAIFGQLFEQKQIEKYYLAISAKKPKKKQGAVKGGMKKVRDGKWMLDSNHSAIAISQFFSFFYD